MPSLVKKLVVVAAVEGLILHPSGQRNQRSLQIKYATHEISSLASYVVPNQCASTEVHGVVGLLNLAPVSYLITILRREQVAQIQGVPIYVITDVALIPLSSQPEAKKAIDQTREIRMKESIGRESSGVDTDVSDEEAVHAEDLSEEGDQTSPVSSGSPTKENLPEVRPGISERSSSNVAEDVIGRKGQYGRFAEKWFSRKGWSTEKRRAQGMSTDDPENPPSATFPREGPQSPRSRSEDTEGPEQRAESSKFNMNLANTLLPKLLRTTRMLLGSRSFFFSYDFDITRRLDTQEKKSSDLPLHKSVDPTFFWNYHLVLPLIESGNHAFALPLMQGFVGQQAFTINAKNEHSSESVTIPRQNVADVTRAQKQPITSDNRHNFLLTLISRRSVKRPGLRYLRRGVDDEGETANTVETEQILSKASWAPTEKEYSFTQIRGSIPLFFSQSPYSLKPVPILQHSLKTNQRAFQRHFAKLMSRYGDVQIALLVDKQGGESDIGRKYEQCTTSLNAGGGIAGKAIGFEWFDFHAVCRGMRFENVNLLMDSLGPRLDEFGKTVVLEGRVQRKQSGVLRTNCMDCLDRTNVVQSACGRRALEQQLKEEGAEVDLLTDTSTQWFNTLWADNGDQISREYSSTAALKGDYTRTRQRNYRGAINDLGLTLSRYFNNIVNDYFSQAAIDYLLGNVTSQVFDDFEATLESRDPAMSMAKVRANAIDTSSKIVVADQHEDLIGGWTLMSPREANSVRTFPFEECVLLLTDVALYCVKFDWNVEKVASFERVDLRSITGILKGVYVTSTLAATQTDPIKNVGFVVKYKPGKEDIARVNTRSLSSAVGMNGIESDDLKAAAKGKGEKDAGLKVLAFKALPARDSFTSMAGQETQAMSEQELVSNVCEGIRRAAVGDGHVTSGFVEESDIISLEEAKKSTGLLEQWSHSLKKMVWA